LRGYISVHILSLILGCCSFGSEFSVKASWEKSYELGTLVSGLFLPIPLGISLQAPSGWMGSAGTQPFSALSTAVQLDSGLGSGWATQGHAQTFSEATPLFSWLCASGLCHVGRQTFATV